MRQFLILGMSLAGIVGTTALALESSHSSTPEHTQQELRAAIDQHRGQLLELFPTLQGMGTSPDSEAVVLTIYGTELSEAEANEQAQSASNLLGVPVRLMVIPTPLTRQP